MRTLSFILALLTISISAKIENKEVHRQVDLTEAGSNLVIFNNQIEFTRDKSDEYYYYTIAKDYAWSFVAINVLYFKDVKRQRDLENDENKFYLHHEQIDSLPA